MALRLLLLGHLLHKPDLFLLHFLVQCILGDALLLELLFELLDGLSLLLDLNEVDGPPVLADQVIAHLGHMMQPVLHLRQALQHKVDVVVDLKVVHDALEAVTELGVTLNTSRAILRVSIRIHLVKQHTHFAEF
jgi:hypothetical protein